MRAHLFALFAVASLSVVAASSQAPADDRPEEKRHLACTGQPCSVSDYEGNVPANFAHAKMLALGCEKPFDHLGGSKPGQTSWVGWSCPNTHAVTSQFTTLPHHFSDGCLKARHGRVYVPMFEATCSVAPWAYSKELNDKARRLGCGEVLHYSPGTGNGFLGGHGSICPETKAVRDYLREPGHLHIGYQGPYCDGCIKVPAGHLFVFWDGEIGPNCPNGCPNRGGPKDI